MNTLTRRFLTGLALTASVTFAHSQSIQVSLPDSATGETGISVSLPITISDVTSRNVFAYQAVITFDNSVLKATGASSSGTLSEIFGAPIVQVDPAGRILVTGSGPAPLSGSGVLVNINFDVIGQPGDMSSLGFQFFLFNTGDPPAVLSNGRFFVTTPQVPDITVRPGSHNFGDVLLDSTALQSFVIANLGQADLRILTAKLTGQDADDFRTRDLNLPLVIPANDSLTFQVLFGPVSEGEKSALLEISSDDPEQAQVQVSLTGSGVLPPEPNITVDPLSLDFGEVELDTFAMEAFVITNAGDGDLLVESTALEGDDATEFVMKGRVAPFTLAPQDRQTYFISFRPNSTGQKKARVTIRSDDPDEPVLQVALTGSGVPVAAPQIFVIPDSLDFGIVYVDSSAAQSLQISNRGNLPLEVTEVNLIGPDASAFAVAAGTLPLLLEPGATTDILVTFRPPSEGTKKASLQILSTDPDEPAIDIFMTGSGVDAPVPIIAVTPDSLDFGTVPVDSSVTLSLEISNVGNLPLEVTEIELTGPGADAFAVTVGSLPLVLDPGATSNFLVTFRAETDGTKQASVQIISNDPEQDTLGVPLTGAGLSNLEILTIIESPQAGQIICGDSTTVEVRATALGGTPPLAVSCTVNGVDAVLVDTTFFVRVPLTTGDNLLVASCRVTDSLGGTATSNRSVTVSRPAHLACLVEITSPQNGTIISGDSVTIETLVQIQGGALPFIVACEINGVEATQANGVFRATIPCPSGVFQIEAVCTVTDSCGNKSECIDSIQVTCSPTALPNLLLGVDKDSKTLVLVDINVAEPEVVKLGKVLLEGESIREMEAMAFDRNLGKIFIISNSNGGRLLAIRLADIPQPPLVRDIPAELIGVTGSTHIDGIALHPLTGELFGTDTETENLIVIDRATAAVTVIGPLGFGDIEGLVFSRDATPVLYGIDNDREMLVTIDIETGTGRTVGDQEVGFRNIECLDFDKSGRLFGFSDSKTDRFIAINAETGVGTEFSVLGANGLDIEGLVFLDSDSFSSTITGIQDVPVVLPEIFSLQQNYPNPFNPSTTIRFSIPVSIPNGTTVHIRIYDLLGRLVQTLIQRPVSPGDYTVKWDGRNRRGEIASAGMYIYQLAAPGFRTSRRMLFVR